MVPSASGWVGSTIRGRVRLHIIFVATEIKRGGKTEIERWEEEMEVLLMVDSCYSLTTPAKGLSRDQNSVTIGYLGIV